MAKIENFGIRKTCIHILNPIFTKALTLDMLPNWYIYIVTKYLLVKKDYLMYCIQYISKRTEKH